MYGHALRHRALNVSKEPQWISASWVHRGAAARSPQTTALRQCQTLRATSSVHFSLLGVFSPCFSFCMHIALYARKRFLFDFIVRGFLYYGNNTLEFLRGTQGRCLRLYRYRPGGRCASGRSRTACRESRGEVRSLPTLYTAPEGLRLRGTRCGHTLRAHAAGARDVRGQVAYSVHARYTNSR